MNKRFKRRPGGVWLSILVVALVLGLRYYQQQQAQESAPPEAPRQGLVAVQRVVDGDTLLLSDRTRVRLIGVDTPESVKPDAPVEPFGPEATDFTRAFIGQGPVRLQFDREREDQYGRTLAYVWVGEQMLNEELLRAGLGRATLRYRFSESMKNRFRKAQAEAQQAGRGIWSE